MIRRSTGVGVGAPVAPERLGLRRAFVPPWWLVTVAALVGAAVTADVLLGGFVVGWDHAISRVFLDWGVRNDPWPKRFTYLLTLPGQRGTVLILTVPTVAFLVWRARSFEPLLRYVVALLLLTASVYALKAATGRLAPPVDALHTSTGASFPSGHIANAIIVWGTVLFVAARTAGTPAWLVRTLRIIAALAPLAVFVGMTILDYHWFSDFVAGACLGIAMLRLAQAAWWSVPITAVDRRLVHW